jgi:hypothetical protein
MRKRGSWLLTLLMGGTGCTTATVRNSNVIGPHGEHLVELQCQLPEQCRPLARESCGGDYDIIATSPGGVMTVGCRNPSTAVATPPLLPQPDAGG